MNYDTLLHHVFCSMYDMNEPEESVFSLQSCFLGDKCWRPSPPDPQQKRSKSYGPQGGLSWQVDWYLATNLSCCQCRWGKRKKCEWPGSERNQDVSCGDVSGIFTRWFSSWPFYPQTLDVANNHFKGSQITISQKVTSRIAMKVFMMFSWLPPIYTCSTQMKLILFWMFYDFCLSVTIPIASMYGIFRYLHLP